jgi:hypothetical protein
MATPMKTPRYGRNLFAKKRKCNTCGYEATWRSNTHKVWCKKQKKLVYCGTMRVIRYE